MSLAGSCSSTMVPEDESEQTPAAAETEELPRRRRRRGKKRKHHKCDRFVSESDVNGNNCDNQVPDAEENQTVEKESSVTHNNNKRRPRGKILIRPVDVPQAPKNSTQFIIDDHEGCGLYVSFETPNPYFKSEDVPGEVHVDLCGDPLDDDAFEDMDYKYESLQDLADDSAYYTQDFEAAYKTLRYDELMRLDKKDLVEAIQNLDCRMEKLEEDLLRFDPNPVLEQHQHKLLALQEQNAVLMENNASLKAVLSVESNDSGSELEEELSCNEAECMECCKSGYVESGSEQSDDCNLSENEERDSMEPDSGEGLELPVPDSDEELDVPVPTSDYNLPEYGESENLEDDIGETLNVPVSTSDYNLSDNEGRDGMEPDTSKGENVPEPSSVDDHVSDGLDARSVRTEWYSSEVQSTCVLNVESISERPPDYLGSENEKAEYHMMSEKMSNVEIAEPLSTVEHL